MYFRVLYFTDDDENTATENGVFRIGLDGSALTRIGVETDGTNDDPYGLVLDEDRK